VSLVNSAAMHPYIKIIDRRDACPALERIMMEGL